ncbi:hypothetical protein EVAR_404_1 [Eumeta japonica]|uniref:Uncharacterized protein n=1 Tax=Eumeta variegata TaxID=151549 RepID=A0A4C1SA09_EUMVA|nr:hypothetical protein EVAR_404_1 [Eumeta japonica]
MRQRSCSNGKPAPQTIAKPGSARNTLMLCHHRHDINGTGWTLLIMSFYRRTKPSTRSLLPTADETQARSRKKYGRNGSTERVWFFTMITPDHTHF